MAAEEVATAAATAAQLVVPEEVLHTVEPTKLEREVLAKRFVHTSSTLDTSLVQIKHELRMRNSSSTLGRYIRRMSATCLRTRRES